MYKLIAHRGEKKSSKENTIAAFFDAINGDYYGFECDIRMTKDKKIVVYHDPMFKGKLIKNYNYKELKSNNIPLLEDVLNIKTDKIIMIDIKDAFIDDKILLKVLNHYKDKNIYVMSFYDNIINKLFVDNCGFKVGILNYVLNTNDNHFKYDFLCILNTFLNNEIINKYEHDKKELFVYGIKRKDIKDLYPYYIVD